MSARTKLNIAFVNGALLASGIIGGIAGSWAVFFVVLGLAIAISVYARDIRLHGQHSAGSRSKERPVNHRITSRHSK